MLHPVEDEALHVNLTVLLFIIIIQACGLGFVRWKVQGESAIMAAVCRI